MRDEILIGPERYKITDNNGNIVLNNIAIELITQIQQVGHSLDKSTLLKDLTSKLFGFEQEAVPDDILLALRKIVAPIWNMTELVRFTTSGQLPKSNISMTVDGLVTVFICGGGAGGGHASYNTAGLYTGGGGGGYALLIKDIPISSLPDIINIIIGAGGNGGVSTSQSGVAGGATSFDIFTVNGGQPGGPATTSSKAGNGGSGGGLGALGGKNGSNGGRISSAGTNYPAGIGGGNNVFGKLLMAGTEIVMEPSSEFSPLNPIDGKLYGNGGAGSVASQAGITPPSNTGHGGNGGVYGGITAGTPGASGICIVYGRLKVS